MLAAHAAAAGATLHLNERDAARADLLQLALGQAVTRHDGEAIDDLLGDDTRPSVVLINPPFSRSEGRGRDRHAGARHLRSALLRLAPGGRCVAIMSPAFARDGSAAGGYDAVASVVPPRWEMTIGGSPFAKHGTSIAVRLLIFDKGWRGRTEELVAANLAEALPAVFAGPDRLPADMLQADCRSIAALPAPAVVVARKPLLAGLASKALIAPAARCAATDPANLCYASRLGLWGNGAFETREAFMSAIADGGIAAMEIVARDLKALGHYTARALTFEGVEYDPLEHKLTADQIGVYDAYADAWALIHRNLDEALAATGIVDRFSGKALNAQAKGAALSRFESAKQRFFGQLLIGMKLPTLLLAIEADLREGRQAVVQLVTTSEALLDRHLAGLSAEERAHLDVELSPREYMIQYLSAAFPTRQMRVFKGSDGEARSELMVDELGNPVFCRDAERRRDELIEQLCAMPAIPGALDELLRHFGTEAVAEVTGRSRRLVVDAGGHQRVERRTGRSNLSEAEAFMTGTKRILVFSDAGGTGRSYHADRNCPTADRRRVHYLLEPGWRASSAIQGLGRTNRTNQASAPIFRPVTTDCRGERRFISTIARRLDSLGALTRGQRQTGGQNLFNPADNLESDYARDALMQWYSLLFRGKLASTSLADFVAMTGLKLVSDDGGGLLDDPTQLPLGRLAEPQEIAEVFLFLASRRAAVITGQVIHANCGGHMA